jgi:hypothetical protein
MGSPDLPQSPQLPKLLEPAERYAYYRRCQRFRKGGQQCKAPAMKDARFLLQAPGAGGHRAAAAGAIYPASAGGFGDRAEGHWRSRSGVGARPD